MTGVQWTLDGIEVNRAAGGGLGHAVTVTGPGGAAVDVTVQWETVATVTPMPHDSDQDWLTRASASERHSVSGEGAVSRVMAHADKQWGDSLGTAQGRFDSVVVSLVYRNPTICVRTLNNERMVWTTRNTGASVHRALGPATFPGAVREGSDGGLSGLYGRAENHATRWVRWNIVDMVKWKINATLEER